LSILSIDSKCV